MVNLFEDLQRELGLAYVFIAHDLSVVRHISDRIAVMYLGKVVEIGPRDALCGRPLHPYTSALVSETPIPDPNRKETSGRRWLRLNRDTLSPADPPSGCQFRTRCAKAQELCATTEPLLLEPKAATFGHQVACHFPEQSEATMEHGANSYIPGQRGPEAAPDA